MIAARGRGIRMRKYLFIAEKPSLMRDIQKVYGKYRAQICSAIDGECVFVALAGHVCGFATPSEYRQWDRKWYELQLPMVPDPWVIRVNPRSKDIYRDVTAAFRDNHCDGIIVGTDSDVEGNGIYYLLEQKAGWGKVPAFRFFLDDQTEKGILMAFTSLTDIHSFPRDVRMTESWLLRAKYDWLVGMNMTVAVTLKQGKLMKIGRVKAPTLKLVYDNCKSIEGFVPHKSYTVNTSYAPGFEGILTGGDGKTCVFEKQAEAEAEASMVTSPYAEVVGYSSKPVRTNPPKLFNLSALQVEAGKKFGYSPDVTLATVQSLYEKHKVMSYPRTDCRYISSEKVKELPGILSAIGNVPGLEQAVKGIRPGAVPGLMSKKQYVNDAEVAKSSHDALLPTHKAPDWLALSPEEKNIYLMVARRLACVLYPPLEETKTELLAQADGRLFKSSGIDMVSPGWTTVEPGKEPAGGIPAYKKGDRIPISKVYIHDRVSSPPKRLTEASLVEAMVHISSKITDKEYKKVMEEDKGIGTEATRGQIIRELREAGYFTVKKQGIHITPLGETYVECLEGIGISDPSLSADMELHMKHVKEGSEDFPQVEKLLTKNALCMVSKAVGMGQTDLYQGKFLSENCPSCGGGLTSYGMGLSCKACGFKLPYKVCNVQLPVGEIINILHHGKSGTVRGFLSKKGNTFDAVLAVEGNRLNFVFPDRESSYRCPVCSRNLTRFPWGYGCPGREDGSCSFHISSSICGKDITDVQMEKLFEFGQTDVIHGFISKKGTRFDARLCVDTADGKISFLYEDGETDNILKCPLCGKAMVKKSWGYCCLAYKKGCDFSIGYNIAGKRIPDKQIRLLIMTGVSSMIYGFRSKKGTEFNAKLELVGKDVRFVFQK